MPFKPSLKFSSNSRYYSIQVPFCCSTIRKAPGITHKYQTRLIKPVRNKHSSVLSSFASYKKIKCCEYYPCLLHLNYLVFSAGKIKKSINQSIYLSINQSIDQSINQSINQSIKQTINQSINQPKRELEEGMPVFTLIFFKARFKHPYSGKTSQVPF